MAKQDTVARLTDLCFALQGAAMNHSRPHRTAEWIIEQVPGYSETRANALKMVSRDVVTLMRAGVPIQVTTQETDDGQSTVYSMNLDQYALPQVEFSAQEAQVLGLAADLGRSGGLGAFTNSGWTKLAASGAERDLSSLPLYSARNDLSTLAPEVLKNLLTLIRNGLQAKFDYVRTATSEPESRLLDPWGLVTLSGRVYLVGWDVHKDAIRIFRLTRISNVRGTKRGISHPAPEENLQAIVEKFLSTSERTDARLHIPHGAAEELAERGTRHGDFVKFKNVDRDWLIRTATGYAPEVIVISPPEIKAAVIELLQQGVR